MTNLVVETCAYRCSLIFRTGNPDLLWQYADLVLDSNEEDGVELFLQDAQDSSQGQAPMDLDPNTVANYLQRYPKSLILYLENLINERRNEVRVDKCTNTPEKT